MNANKNGGKLPIWWSATRDNNTTANPYNGNATTGWLYADYWADLMTKMAARYDSNPLIADCTMSGTMAVYSEPPHRHVYASTITQSLTASNGLNPVGTNQMNMAFATGLGGGTDTYSLAKDKVAMEGCISAMTAWTTTRTSIAFLPWDYVTGTTIAAASDGVSLPTSTINVASTSGFASSGLLVINSTAGLQVVNYTGKTSTTFTGCTNGSGTLNTAQQVTNGQQSTAATWEVMHYAITVLGDQLVNGNNGFQLDANGDFSVPTCKVVAAYQGPIYYQTRTAAQQADLSVNIMMAAQYGAQCVELPDSKNGTDQGYQNWSSSDARILAGITSLKGNAQPRRLTGAPPQGLLTVS
jgi:hypothetical protein